MSAPRVVFGAAVYNHAEQAREAFESILAQTHADFALVVVDDCSTDGTYEIAQEYARLDPRVTVFRNERRVGMIENWRRAFWKSRSLYPHAEYFAWASDHDLWHPRWLSTLVRTLDGDPQVVLAYPLNAKIFPDGQPVDRKPWYFDTAGVSEPLERLRSAGWQMSAGNMIYGLFRIEPLVRAGVFRRVLVPDRLLLSELSLFGQFRQVPEILWFRRWYGRVFSLSRQRASFFPNGRPLYAHLPWWFSHTVSFGWHLAARGTGRPAIGRLAGLRLAFEYIRIALPLHIVQESRAFRLFVIERTSALRARVRGAIRFMEAVPRRATRGMAGVFRRTKKRMKNVIDEAIRIPGVAVLQTLRAIPLVRNRAIPWLLREEIHQIPSARAVITMKKELRRVADSGTPILVGPWLSEVGFELLYWIPFLNWATREYGLNPDRLIVLSRGGAECWYRHLCKRSIDLFDLITIDEYRRKNVERWTEGGNQKQYDTSEFDHEIVELVKDKLGERDLTILHPSVMYQLFRFYWYEKGAVSILRDHCDYRPLPSVGPPPDELPPDYVAVRFYFRPSFPDTPSNRAFIGSVIRSLAGHVPVVLLNTGLNVDDHEDYIPTDSGVYRVEHLMTPNRNLEVQTAIIAGARGLVGTYGGLTYLGPLYGVPAIGLYSHSLEVVAAHLDMTERLSRALETPAVTMNIQMGELLGLTFENLIAQKRAGAGASVAAS